MEKKKTNKGIIVTIIILIILVIGLGGYIVYDKVLTESKETTKISNDNVTKNDNTKAEDLKIDSSLVQTLYNRVYDNRDYNLGSWIYSDSKDITIAEMSEESKFELVYHNLLKKDFEYSNGSEEINKTFDNRVYTVKVDNEGFISKKAILRVYEEIFGTTSTFVDSTVMYTDRSKSTAYIYTVNKDKQEEGWMLYQAIGGLEGAYTTERNITKAVRTATEIKLSETITATDPDNGKTIENVTYTFKQKDDGTYYYYSRVVE